MVPTELSQEAFGRFNAIPQSRIDHELDFDLGEAADRFRALLDATIEHLGLPLEKLTAEACAEHMHNEMMMPLVAGRIPNYPEAINHHLAAAGARGAAQVALQVAGEKGELGELNNELDKLRAKSGEEDFDELDQDVWPEGYLENAEKAGEHLLRIEKMMVADVLRKYRFYEMAKLFEEDEERFDAKTREGYFLMHPGKLKPGS